MKFPEVMTMSELAQYLRLAQSTLYQLAREGAIPGVKVGRHWRFHREAVDQ
jgi:excisionase family DNA binding protein